MIAREFFELDKKAYPVIGHVTGVVNGTKFENVPRLHIQMMSDYHWQISALKDRLERPEVYELFENVPCVIERLRRWLVENDRLATPQERRLAQTLVY